MIEWIQNFIRNYSNGMYFPHIQIKDIIEIYSSGMAFSNEYNSVSGKRVN